MKKILFLLLFPCFALAQYQGNANQKITLGEQTTADGLVWRGIRADTTSKIVPFSDTSAYIILDTVEKTLWLYKAGQVPKWQQVGGSGGGGGGGTVTSITGGTGLTGGTITTSGTLAADTSFLFTQSDTLSLNLTSRLSSKLNIADTTNMLLPYFRDADTTTLNLTSRFAAKQNNITLTTTGTSGAATLTGATLNIPQYSGGAGITDGDKGDIDVTNSGATWTIDTSAVSLSGNKVTGTLPVANGGTGQTTATAALNALLPAQSQSTTIGATLKSNGTNSYWDNFSASGTVQDQSGNFYNTIAIGTQVWFKENLRTKKYRSGALIPVKTNTDTSTIVGQMYYYNNDSLTNYSVYGALYNWKATQSSDSLCPVGWHVPTDAEWTTLTTYLGGESVAGGKMKSVGTAYWNSPNTGATNESGFSLLPGGYRNLDGNFYSIRSNVIFWSATQYDGSNAWGRYLYFNYGDVFRGSYNKSVGALVRCLKN